MTAPSQLETKINSALLAHIRQDFSAPVAAILGYLELLADDPPLSDHGQLAADFERMHQAGLTLQRLVASILDTRENAALALDGSGDLGSKLRHDLRTPLNAIKGYAEMLLEEVHSETVVQDLNKLLDESKQLLGRIDALVDFQAGTVATALSTRPESEKLVAGALQFISRPALENPGSYPANVCRILVVDDNASNRDLLARRLARDSHMVATADGGEQALRLVEEQAFDLILLDLLMPDVSGYEVLRRLKRDPRHRDVPVIMVSALDQIDSVVRCIEAGAEDYMPKPFDPILLRARINACLEKKRLREREKMFVEQLRQEKEKSEALLRNILPTAIVSRLNQGETIIADHIADATILFADLVGFTGLSARLSATRLIGLLNILFSEFDRLCLDFGLEKIKTIGDAYMVAGGLIAPGRDQAPAVADMALGMLDVSRATGELLDMKLALRIGIHNGPVVAGVIGTHRFIYDVWGDTVNVASRMESHGLANEVNVTEALFLRLRNRFVFEPRGVIDVLGKGPTMAYFLRGKARSAQPSETSQPTT
jgi:DNA-binding response OmpR family regulator